MKNYPVDFVRNASTSWRMRCEMEKTNTYDNKVHCLCIALEMMDMLCCTLQPLLLRLMLRRNQVTTGWASKMGLANINANTRNRSVECSLPKMTKRDMSWLWQTTNVTCSNESKLKQIVSEWHRKTKHIGKSFHYHRKVIEKIIRTFLLCN